MNTFYKLISFIFQPLLMPTFGVILLMNMDIFSVLPPLWRWVAIVGTFVFTGLLPAIPILLMMRRGDVTNLFISKREERTIPYLFSFLAYVFWAFFLWRTMQFPLFIVSIGISSAASIVLIMLINTKWKISAHLSAMGGFTGSIFGVCYRMAVNPVWVFVLVLGLSALVALSRMELKAHTPGQTIAGFTLGFLIVFVPCMLV